jgi:nicotinate-nucleotide pyrophosphorylase (carboxylating)
MLKIKTMKNTFDKAFAEQLDTFIDLALREDAPEGDHTSLACIPENDQCKAILKVKDSGVIAGVAVAEFVFKKVDPNSEIRVILEDGSHASYGDIAFEVKCNTHALLKAERIVLNIMQRLSGIATLANRFAFEVEDLPVKILDTRKTTPLMRFLEKWAVRIGGCYNYRDNLSDWFMIKDNHIKACGGVSKALSEVSVYKNAKGLDLLNVTVEVKNLVELHQALNAGGFKRIMFDNFEPVLLEEAVATVGGRYETEASGGINIHNVRRYARTGVDYISVGSLTHSAQSLDLSLKVID